MSADLRKEAQQRADRITVFRRELGALEQEGALALTAEQRSRLDAHLEALLGRLQGQYGVDATDSARRVSWGMRVVSLLGAAALLAAAVLFLHRVWGHMSLPPQLVILTAVPLVLLGVAEIAHRRRAGLYYVALLALAAGVAFVMEMNAVGAVLNLTDSPMILLAWGAFALLVAYAYSLRLILAAGLVLVCVWSAAFVLHLRGYYWVEFAQTSQLLIPGALVLYGLPWLTAGRGPDGFESVYRLCGASLGLLALLALSTFGDVCCGGIGPDTVAAAYQVIGVMAAAGVLFHGLQLGRAALVNVGALGFIVFLYIRLHAWWWHWMPKYLFCLLLAIIAFGLLLVFRRVRARMSKGGTAL